MDIIKLVRSIFGVTSQESKASIVVLDSNTYYFHEDSYRQIELLPKENFTLVARTAEEIAKLDESNFDDNGWTNCYIRNEVDFPMINREIDVKAMSDFMLENGFSEFSKVATGYSSTIVECQNITAFEKDSIKICFDFKGNIVNSVWLNSSPFSNDSDQYKDFLLNISLEYQLLLADWNNSTIVDSTIPEEIDKYFNLKE
jgi:hypothetical protein